ncbi:MAG: endonuclease/exonuclease/phosphatase family protein, partial [Bacteroidota bacterium]
FFVRNKKAFWATAALAISVLLAWPLSRELRLGFSQADAGSAAITVISYNVASFHFEDEQIRRVAKLMKDQRADVIALQEFRNHSMANGRQALPFLAAELDMPYYQFRHLPQHIHGAVIFSKYPIESLEVLYLPAEEINSGVLATIQTPQGPIGVATMHLSSYQMREVIEDRMPGDRWHMLQGIYRRYQEVLPRQQEKVNLVLEKVARYPHPLVITGDFNSVPHSRIVEPFRRQFVDSFTAAGRGLGWTFPLLGSAFGLRIDYQFCTEDLHPLQHQIIREEPSDHFPIMVSYRLTHP